MVESASMRNRLAEADSPYLRDHADDPVHWQPWDDQALALASERDVPIFLSIGYAACHWCHVMADESFSDEAIAEQLNEHFVPIKVDREERPDVDRLYQAACQAAGTSAGWPLSAWLTPEGKPFIIATYLPPEPRQGLPAFPQLMGQIADRWEDQREDFDRKGEEVLDALDEMQRSGTDTATSAEAATVVETAAESVHQTMDDVRGGFGTSGSKFPQVPRLELVKLAWLLTDRDAYGTALETTLDGMAEGGIYDHVEGGFHRYATDPQWHVPHFEKMLYDNVGLLGLYAEAAHRLDAPQYADVARETAAFLQRRLRTDAGGFAASLDAVADGEEGATYVWTPADVDACIEDRTTREIVTERFGIDDEADAAGGTVLEVRASIDDLAQAHDMPADGVTEAIDSGLARMADHRAQRPQPRRDEKVLAAWNGLAMSGFATAGVFLDEPDFLEVADELRAFIDAELFDAQANRLYRVYRDGDASVEGFLEDYAAVARGAFDLYWAGGDAAACRLGLRAVDGLLETCWDADRERLRFTPTAHSGLPMDPLDARDRAIPSPVGLTLSALADADGFHDDGIRPVASAIRDRYGSVATDQPLDHPSLAMAIERWWSGPQSVTLVHETMPDDWRAPLQHHDRRLLITRRPPGDDPTAAAADLGLEAVPPMWRNRTRDDDRPTLYPCAGRTCGPPTFDPEDALAWFEREQAGGSPTPD